MKPLAERLRPTTLDGYIGQKHLVGEGAVLRKMIESGNLASFILWGPPGVGKTTLAQIIATQSQRSFYSLSAVSSSVKDVREGQHIVEIKPNTATIFAIQTVFVFNVTSSLI